MILELNWLKNGKWLSTLLRNETSPVLVLFNWVARRMVAVYTDAEFTLGSMGFGFVVAGRHLSRRIVGWEVIPQDVMIHFEDRETQITAGETQVALSPWLSVPKVMYGG